MTRTDRDLNVSGRERDDNKQFRQYIEVPAKILVMSTSPIEESYDGRLSALATKTLAAKDAVLTVLNLTEYPLPPYHDRIDVSDDVPLEARSLHKLALRQNGVL